MLHISSIGSDLISFPSFLGLGLQGDDSLSVLLIPLPSISCLCIAEFIILVFKFSGLFFIALQEPQGNLPSVLLHFIFTNLVFTWAKNQLDVFEADVLQINSIRYCCSNDRLLLALVYAHPLRVPRTLFALSYGVVAVVAVADGGGGRHVLATD